MNEQAPINLSGEGSGMFTEMDNDFPIDNPDGMPDEDNSDDDPEILEEIDRRQEEIIEQFMELSYICKHEAQEILMQQEDTPEDDLQDQTRALNKEMDTKRKKGLKALKNKLNQITNDESLHA
jgi:hypothetical protein